MSRSADSRDNFLNSKFLLTLLFRLKCIRIRTESSLCYFPIVLAPCELPAFVPHDTFSLVRAVFLAVIPEYSYSVRSNGDDPLGKPMLRIIITCQRSRRLILIFLLSYFCRQVVFQHCRRHIVPFDSYSKYLRLRTSKQGN